MIDKLIKLFNKKNKLPNLNRIYSVDYFLDKIHQQNFIENGYVVIKNSVEKSQRSFLKDVYKQLELMNGFELKNNFVNSGRFNDTKIRKFVVENIELFSKNNLKNLFNIQHCVVENGGNFQIKPASKHSVLNPHQDSPIIDETTYYAVYIWIPLCDITLQNGPVWVLPKSHLWCNYQRSLNVKWTFENHHKLLWKYMQPITLNAGDILCFYSALIHASSSNNTNKTRIAITTTALPKNYQLVEYFKDEKTPENKIEKYHVDQNYYINENINERPDDKFTFVGYENHIFNHITSSQIKELIKKHQP